MGPLQVQPRSHACAAMGGVCRVTNAYFLFAVDDRTQQTLHEAIKETILPGSRIITDCFPSYNVDCPICLDTITLMKQLITLRIFVDPETGTHTNTMEGMWRIAKESNKKKWGIHKSTIDSYLCEFVHRRRHHGENLFDVIWTDIVEFYNNNN